MNLLTISSVIFGFKITCFGIGGFGTDIGTEGAVPLSVGVLSAPLTSGAFSALQKPLLL